MISKLRVGERYNIIGAGNWSDIDMDIVVLGVTIYSQLDPQEIDIYADWFEPYEIDESTFEKMMEDDPYIYHCRKISSRMPALDDNSGEDVHIFPGMLNYPNTQKLIDAKIYSYKTSTAPYTEKDELNPLKLSNESAIKSALKDTMKSLIYDGVTSIGETIDILVTESEYEKLTDSRVKIKSKVSGKTNEDAASLLEERAYMYSMMESNELEAERLRNLDRALKDQLKVVSAQHNNNISLQSTLNVREMVLKNKHYRLKQVIDEYNEGKLAGDQIYLPDWDNL